MIALNFAYGTNRDRLMNSVTKSQEKTMTLKSMTHCDTQTKAPLVSSGFFNKYYMKLHLTMKLSIELALTSVKPTSISELTTEATQASLVRFHLNI